MKMNKEQRGNTLLGVAIGIVVGVLISLAVVWFMNRTEPPFREPGTRTDRPGNGDSGKVAPLPGKPGDKVGDASGDKPRFEFYKILPGSQDAAPVPESKGSDAKGAKPAEPLWLQVGAFQKPADADNLKAKLALIGLDAGVQEVDLPDKGLMYRVRTGPFKSVEEMNQAKSLLSQNGIQASQVKGK
jgi:cell division protein FtsN